MEEEEKKKEKEEEEKGGGGKGRHCYSSRFIDETTEAQRHYLKVQPLVFFPLVVFEWAMPSFSLSALQLHF